MFKFSIFLMNDISCFTKIDYIIFYFGWQPKFDVQYIFTTAVCLRRETKIITRISPLVMTLTVNTSMEKANFPDSCCVDEHYHIKMSLSHLRAPSKIPFYDPFFFESLLNFQCHLKLGTQI